MKNFPISAKSKAIAFLLCLIAGSVAFWSTLITAQSWDDLWFGGDYYSSNAAIKDTLPNLNTTREIMRLRQVQIWDGKLSYSDQERLQSMTAELAANVSNFRYQVHAENGTLLGSNLTENDTLHRVVGRVRLETFRAQSGERMYENDYTYWDDSLERQIRVVGTAEGPVLCDPKDTANSYNQYGWLSDGESWQDYDAARDMRIRTTQLVLEYGIQKPMTVHDTLLDGMNSYDEMQRSLPTMAILALCTLTVTLTLLIFLCRNAGLREGQVFLVPNWQDRIPYDLYLLLDTLLTVLLLGAGDAVAWGFNRAPRMAAVVGICILTLNFSALAIGFLLTTTYRLKAHTLLRNTLIWRLCKAIGRSLRDFVKNFPITRRPILLFVLYLVGTVLSTVTFILIPVFQGIVLYLLCRWVRQWRAIQVGTQRIVGGDPDARIETDPRMFRDLKSHAEQLNDLGSSIGNAVEERLKSERFKAELITNVSHDLKTPLTSIINYVDLLKKVEIEDPKALEYIEVLDRKSQRLKKLTEDLVEASKASTGNLTVNRERLGVIQLTQQALAEYEEKFMQARLDIVPTLHPTELYVEADGRHLWRIIDNLLGNCYKYALEGTRIYLDVTRWDGTVTLAIKNVSKQQLNIPADQLMERFVRGEAARATEGSGLGLSIARSLTEVQGGTFRLAIDGDLFKAVVSFPEAPLVVPPWTTLPPHGSSDDSII